MTLAEQLHQSATHKGESDPNCPVCTKLASVSPAECADATDKPDEVTISGRHLLRQYNELKAAGYVTVWSGEGQIRMAKPTKYEVVVGNIGSVLTTTDFDAATAKFATYKEQSVTGYGRAAGEPVVIMANGEPMSAWDYAGTLANDSSDDEEEDEAK